MMPRARPEPVQVIKKRRDAALRALVAGCPISGSWASPSTGGVTS
jgi:hypothetical protein